MNTIDVLDKLIEMKWWAIERRIEAKHLSDEEYQTWCALVEQIKATITIVQEKYP